MNTIKFYTLGCKVNQYETQAIRENLINNGFKEVDSDNQAHIYIINTCTVTSRAEGKSQGLIRKALNENLEAKVIVTGCCVQDNNFISQDKRIIAVKNELKNKISQILNNQSLSNSGGIDSYLNLSISDFKGHNRAFVKIQDGCENNCSYCKVTLARGELRSRELSEIKKEVKRLVNKGFREIVLTGICLGAYGKDFKNSITLSDIIEEVIDLPGEFRVRLSSIEAGYISDRVIKLLSASSKLCRHLHIPFQSGDNEILKKMNRHYSSKDYLALVQKIRAEIPDIAITTDIMVGFPGEKDENFQNTFSFLKEVSPSRMHIFPFSPREGTLAYNFADRVSHREVKLRMAKLQILAKQKSLEYRQKFLKKEVDVLVETARSKINGYLKGYTDTYIHVLVDGNDSLINKIIKVKIDKVDSDFTFGENHYN